MTMDTNIFLFQIWIIAVIPMAISSGSARFPEKILTFFKQYMIKNPNIEDARVLPRYRMNSGVGLSGLKTKKGRNLVMTVAKTIIEIVITIC